MPSGTTVTIPLSQVSGDPADFYQSKVYGSTPDTSERQKLMSHQDDFVRLYELSQLDIVDTNMARVTCGGLQCREKVHGGVDWVDVRY